MTFRRGFAPEAHPPSAEKPHKIIMSFLPRPLPFFGISRFLDSVLSAGFQRTEPYNLPAAGMAGQVGDRKMIKTYGGFSAEGACQLQAGMRQTDGARVRLWRKP
ncbi:MAG: hypothetical protein HY088_01570 [Ignavibacteriales bacterium]|nr:hypothetical protein [Ignavibacteriales bacterium]